VYLQFYLTQYTTVFDIFVPESIQLFSDDFLGCTIVHKYSQAGSLLLIHCGMSWCLTSNALSAWIVTYIFPH